MANEEVKIDAVAMALPLGDWFTKKMFSDLTGIGFKSCTRRLNKLIDKKMLIADKTKNKNFYMMDEECFRLMMKASDARASVVRASLEKGRKKKRNNSSAFDKLLFSTRFV